MKTYKTTIKGLRLVREASPYIKVKVTTVEEVSEYARQFYGSDMTIYESFWVLFLNRSNVIESAVKISQGGVSGTVVDVKLICRYAIEGLSSSVILIHNHPGGDFKPSLADKKLTDRIKKALSVFDIGVLDHIILTEAGCFSFNEDNLL
jgi:DNA repair protein RadC